MSPLGPAALPTAGNCGEIQVLRPQGTKCAVNSPLENSGAPYSVRSTAADRILSPASAGSVTVIKSCSLLYSSRQQAESEIHTHGKEDF